MAKASILDLMTNKVTIEVMNELEKRADEMRSKIIRDLLDVPGNGVHTERITWRNSTTAAGPAIGAGVADGFIYCGLPPSQPAFRAYNNAVAYSDFEDNIRVHNHHPSFGYRGSYFSLCTPSRYPTTATPEPEHRYSIELPQYAIELPEMADVEKG